MRTGKPVEQLVDVLDQGWLKRTTEKNLVFSHTLSVLRLLYSCPACILFFTMKQLSKIRSS